MAKTFRSKIFIAFILMNIVVVSAIAYFSYRQNLTAFRKEKLKDIKRVDGHIEKNFKSIFNADNQLDEKKIESVRQRVFELANVYNLRINIYDTDGVLLVSSYQVKDRLGDSLLREIGTKEIVIKDEAVSNTADTLYSRFISVKNEVGGSIAIINTQNIINEETIDIQGFAVLKYYSFLAFFIILLGAYIAWFVSKNLTKKIGNISSKLEKTDVSYLDKSIEYTENDEIKPLVDAYNNMLGRLKEQTAMIKQSQRKETLREVAKKMAHEINNPLTPLRLTVQNFQRKYDPNDPNNTQKVKTLTDSVIHHIDIISAITKSLSTHFDAISTNHQQSIEVVEVVRRTLDIFPPTIVSFSTNVERLDFNIDTISITRVITNIVKNSIQAANGKEHMQIQVAIKDNEKDFTITIKDNGSGIPDEIKNKIFEREFTTKETGTGFGLFMVKEIIEDYNGKIWFESNDGEGTIFYILFKK
ncbi:MAG: HAMP domain-containing sensor histidine kinase [Bergeyella zoohelcum]|nr:HAMP domain-containing sensor histidine kinase [Bergeyella zoohelcum]